MQNHTKKTEQRKGLFSPKKRIDKEKQWNGKLELLHYNRTEEIDKQQLKPFSLLH